MDGPQSEKLYVCLKRNFHHFERKLFSASAYLHMCYFTSQDKQKKAFLLNKNEGYSSQHQTKSPIPIIVF